MNIFFLHWNICINARFYCDQHVRKIILEICQMLYAAHHVLYALAHPKRPKAWQRSAPNGGWRAAYVNHPMTVWVRESPANYQWSCEMGLELCREFTRRFGKVHAVQAHLEWLLAHLPPFPDQAPATSSQSAGSTLSAPVSADSSASSSSSSSGGSDSSQSAPGAASIAPPSSSSSSCCSSVAPWSSCCDDVGVAAHPITPVPLCMPSYYRLSPSDTVRCYRLYYIREKKKMSEYTHGVECPAWLNDEAEWNALDEPTRARIEQEWAEAHKPKPKRRSRKNHAAASIARASSPDAASGASTAMLAATGEHAAAANSNATSASSTSSSGKRKRRSRVIRSVSLPIQTIASAHHDDQLQAAEPDEAAAAMTSQSTPRVQRLRRTASAVTHKRQNTAKRVRASVRGS